MAITKTVNSKISVDAESNLVTYEGLSTDSKPTTEVATNSRFHELDTGKYYFFSAGSWTEIPSSGGGGSTNTTETYTGTLDGLYNRFVQIFQSKYSVTDNYRPFYNDYASGNVSGGFTFTFNGNTYNTSMSVYIGDPDEETDGHVTFQGFDPLSTSGYHLAAGIYSGSPELYASALIGGNTMDLSPYLSYIPYTLTLYWHEM